MMNLTSLYNILKSIAQAQEHLDALRQLLNEEIQFNINDTFHTITTKSQIHQLQFTDFLASTQLTQESISSVMNFYSHALNRVPSLVKKDLQCMLLSRQNKLLAKMVKQRQPLGAIPNYIMNFVRKIFTEQTILHSKLIAFQKQHSQQMNQLLMNIRKPIQCTKLVQICLLGIQNLEKQENVQHLVKRYIHLGDGTTTESKLTSLLVGQHHVSISKPVCKKKKRIKGQKDPFIHKQFQKFLSVPKTLDIFSCREINAIQQHLNRLNHTYSQQLTSKISLYRVYLQKSVIKVLNSLRKMISYERQVQYERTQISLLSDCNIQTFFRYFCLDRQNCLIPSVMLNSLHLLGIGCQVQDVFLVFKRFSNRQDGKINYQCFKNMFNSCRNPNKYQHKQQITTPTKQRFINFIITNMKNQNHIEHVRQKLNNFKSIELREVFDCLDIDQDGNLTRLDMQKAWRKFLDIQISKEDLQLLWKRLNCHQVQQKVHYEQFIAELLPKTTHYKKWVC